MTEYEVTISYQIQVTEVFRVEVNKSDPDELAEFLESPYDICHPGNRTDKWEGDVVDGSWHERVRETCVLDRIVEATE